MFSLQHISEIQPQRQNPHISNINYQHLFMFWMLILGCYFFKESHIIGEHKVYINYHGGAALVAISNTEGIFCIIITFILLFFFTI